MKRRFAGGGDHSYSKITADTWVPASWHSATATSRWRSSPRSEWLKRLMLHEETIRRRWGPQLFEDYRRYLGACVMAFRDGYQSLAQFAQIGMAETLNAA